MSRLSVAATLELLLAVGVAADPANAVHTDAPKATATPVKVEPVATGLSHPWGLQFLPDGRMLVTERDGRLRIVSKDGKLSVPIKGVPEVYARGQGGLLDVRLGKDFRSSGTIFLSYSEPRDGWGKSGTSVARARLVFDEASGSGRLDNVNVIFRQEPAQSTSHHYGSRVVIGADGTLFITTGDRGRGAMAQDPSSQIGKIIRINPDGSVPEDNPKVSGWSSQVWSIGHRNLQGAAVDPKTGALWTVEHGARGGDELNRPEAKKNYGWPVISYGRNYDGSKIGVGQSKEGYEQPVYYWDPSIATSGLAIYDGDLFTSWKGNILVGGLAGACLSRLVVKNGEVVAEEVLLKDRGDRIRDVRVGPDGAVYLLVDEGNGSILKLTPAAL